MPKSDGSMVIDTHIDTKDMSVQMRTLENRLSKFAKKASTVTDEMRKMESAKIPTDEFAAAQKQIEDTSKKMSALNDRMEKFIAIGGKTDSRAFKSMQYDLEQLTNSLEYARGEAQDYLASGMAYKSVDDIKSSPEYQKKAEQLSEINAQMEIISQKIAEVVAKEDDAAASAERLASKEREASQEAQNLGEKGKKSADELASKENKVAHNADKARRSTSFWLDLFANKTKRTSGLIHNLATRLRGIALSLFIFNWITKGWNAMLSAVKDGTQNMAKYSSDVNAKMSQLTSAVATLKNAFGSLSAPIISAVGPALTYLINMLTAAINKVNQFISALTGKTTWTKATTKVKDYAAGLDKASGAAKKLKGQLQSFNELNNISSNDGGSGGAGGGSGNVSDMFEEMPIDQGIADLAEEIKNAIKSGDWEGIGTLIQEQLCDAVDKIKWRKIYKKADFFGINFAKFLNGLFKTDKKGRSVFTATAKIMAGSLNTALHLLDSFGDTFEWKEFGKSFAKGLKTFFKTWDAGLTGKTLSTFVKGLLEAITSAIKTTSTDKTWKDIGQDIADFICGIDWSGITFDFVEFWDALKEAIIQWPQDLVSGFIEGLVNNIFGEDAGKKVKEFIDNFYSTPLAKALSAFNLQTFIDAVPAFKTIDNFVKKIREISNLNKLFQSLGKTNNKKGVLGIKLELLTTPKELWEKFKKSWGENRKVQFLLFIASKAKKLWETFKKSWGEENTAKFLLKIYSRAKELWSDFKDEWGTRTATFSLKIGSKIKDLWDSFKTSWGEKRSVSFLTKNSKDTTAGKVWSLFKTAWGSRSVSIGISFAKNALSGLWNSLTSFFSGKKVGVGAEKKANGGIYTGGMWHSITAYATGTEHAPAGQLFVAREAGPELVGTLGGHTAVMNNDQIVASVSDGVARAVRSVIGTNGSNVNVIVKLEGDANGLFKMTQQKANEYFRITGNPAFDF